MKLLSVTIILFWSLFEVSRGARILGLFPTPSYSHQVVYRALMVELAARGHEVVVLTTDPMESPPPNLEQIDASEAYQGFFHKIDYAMVKEDNLGTISLLSKFALALEEIMETQLAMPEMQRLIHDPTQHFDAVIAEFIGYTPIYAFAEYFNATLIGFTSFEPTYHEHMAVGNMIHPVLHPMNIFHNYRDLNFVERFLSVSLEMTARVYYELTVYQVFDRIIEQNFGDNVSRSAQLRNRADMLLLNCHPALDYIRPIVPATIQLGFMHIKPPKALPMELQNYMDRSEHGVIFFSLGTNVKSSKLKKGTIEMLLGAFRQLKYDILWKWENGDMSGKPDNVRTIGWVPQADLLAHRKMKLFISQGGQQSIEEALDRAVPMIIIPFFVDQYSNAKRIVNRGIGLTLDLNSLTSEKFKDTIVEVIQNSKYKENIKQLSVIAKDEPMKPVEKAVWWTEYAIRHKGARHLRYQGLDLPMWKFLLLDVIAAYIVILSALAYFVKGCVRWLSKRFRKLKLE